MPHIPDDEYFQLMMKASVADVMCKNYEFAQGMLGESLSYSIKMSRPPNAEEIELLIEKLVLDLRFVEKRMKVKPALPTPQEESECASVKDQL